MMSVVRMSQIIIFKVKKTMIKTNVNQRFVFYRITCQNPKFEVESSNIKKLSLICKETFKAKLTYKFMKQMLKNICI